MKNNEKKYYNLGQFLGCRFHQDWNLDYATPDESIHRFIVSNGISVVVVAYLELKQLLKEKHRPDEWEIIIMDDLGVDYDYTSAQGLNHTEWLEWVQKRMFYHAQEQRGIDLEELSNYCQQYSNLANFLSECFKYAWDVDYVTPEDALRGSIIGSGKLLIKGAYVELKQLLKEEHIPEEWNFLIIECMSIRYDKASQGLEHKKWLEWVKDRMQYYAQVEKGLDLEKETAENKPLQAGQ